MIRKSYPNYKFSGIEWLGDVPEHWGSLSLKWASVRYSGGTPDRSIQEYWEDGTIPWLNSGAVNDDLITEPSTYITSEAFQNSSAKWIPKGALVMALAGQGKTKGMVAQLGIRTTCNQSMAAIVPGAKIIPRFLYWWLTNNYLNIRNLAGGEARDGLNLDLIGSIPVPLLPVQEQQTIAAFLDRETNRIDRLIDKKKKLIELLKEKRTTMISRAVTKGLDTSAKLKPSEVEWLGDVPEHWEVNRLKYQTSINDDTLPEDTDPDFEILYVDIGSVSPAEGIVKKEKFLFEDAPSRARRIVKNGDTIVSTVRTYLRAIASIINPEDNLVVSTGFAVIRPKNIFAGYLSYVLNAPYFIEEVVSRSVGVSYPAIKASMIGEIFIPIPSFTEQQRISNFLDAETVKIDNLVSKVEVAIERLKEYRITLISSAVTGKIDVRDIQ